MTETKDDNVVALEIVRNAVEAAPEVEAPAAEPGDPNVPPDDAGPRKKRRGGLPDDCPVTPLGLDDNAYYFLDHTRQYRQVAHEKLGHLTLLSLFAGRTEYLYATWPRKKEDKAGGWIITGWNTARVQEQLADACQGQGVWNAFERERGLGAWRDDDGRLVLHCGDAIWISEGDARVGYVAGSYHVPGLIEGYVYPAARALPRPDPNPIDLSRDTPGEDMLTLLKTWHWRRGETDALLLLGWIGAAMICGALDWRPLAWPTGGHGTGKSTLFDLLKAIGAGGFYKVSDATAAGIWQKLGHSTLPVILDESESKRDNRAIRKVIELARQAASGGLIWRGGADHNNHEFRAQSAFLFTSILVPPLTSQDRSRIAILELLKFEKRPDGSLPPVPRIDAKPMAALGAKLRRRMVDGWGRWGDTLEAYRTRLAELGHSARGCDQYGTLLAAADVLLFDGLPHGDQVDAWCERLRPSELVAWDDNAEDESNCLHHILGFIIDPYRGGTRRTVGEWVEEWLGAQEDHEKRAANKALGQHGMRCEQVDGEGYYFAVANRHRGLNEVFAGSHWAGESDESNPWVQTLQRLEGAAPGRAALYFAGDTQRATLIPMALVAAIEPGGAGKGAGTPADDQSSLDELDDRSSDA